MSTSKPSPRSSSLATEALAAFVCLLVCVAPEGAAAVEGEPAFCQRTILHDYLAPLRQLPRLRELARTGYRRFAVDGVGLQSSGRPLAINVGFAGYELSWRRNPRWRITVKVARVNARGAVVQEVGERRVRLAPLAPAQRTTVGFPLPRRPAFYRATMKIRSRSGATIATFGNYYGVVRPRVDDRLVTEKSAYLSGETLLARVENPGLEFVLFGEGFNVEALRGNAWVPVSEGFGSLYTPLRFIGPGATGGPCLTATIPATAAPGRYRLSQGTVLSWPHAEGERRPTLQAEFEVSAPAP